MGKRTFTPLREGLLPLALLAAALLGRGETAAALAGAFLAARLCALCPDRAYLRAASDELDLTRLSRLRATAVLLTALGAGAALALMWFFAPHPWDALRLYGAAGVLLLLSQVCEAFLAADGEWGSAALSQFLLSALLLTALLLGNGPAFGESLDAPRFLAAAALPGALISALMAARLGTPDRPKARRPYSKLFKRAPLGLIRDLLCPLLLAGLTILAGLALLPAALAGWALFAMSAALYRRAPEETHAMAAALVPAAACLSALAVLPPLLPALRGFQPLDALAEAAILGLPCAALPTALAAFLALALGASFTPALAACAGLLLLQGLLPAAPWPFAPYLSLAAGGLALLLSLFSLREALVPLRARRRRKKLDRQKRSRAA